MELMDRVISDLFRCWVGAASNDVEIAKEQLKKNLNDQIAGYWSGATAYWIMTHGGFLLDGKKGEKKKLTAFGHEFMRMMGGDK